MYSLFTLLLIYFLNSGNTTRGESAILTPRSPVLIAENTPQTFTCTTTVQQNWRSIVFYDYTTSAAVVLFYNTGNSCGNFGYDQSRYSPTCDSNNGIFNLTIKNVSVAYDRTIIKCEAIYGTGNAATDVKVQDSVEIFLQVAPLTGPVIVQSPQGPINEGNAVVLTCEVIGGNPLANLSWQCPDASVVQSTEISSTEKVTYIIQLIINRLLNGKPCICTAVHILWTVQKSKSHTLVVYWQPVLNPDIVSSPPIIRLKIGKKLNITINVISNPNPRIQWFFDHTNTMKNITEISDTSSDGFQHRSTLILADIDSGQLGSYNVIISNNIGNLIHTFSVIQPDLPASPNFVSVYCKTSTATLVWRSAFNGGDEQHFKVQSWMIGESTRTTLQQDIPDQGFDLDQKFTIRNLSIGTEYCFTVIAINDFGSSYSKEVNCTTDGTLGQSVTKSQESVGLFAAGIAALFVAITIVVVFSILCRLISRRNELKRSENYTELNTINAARKDLYNTLQDNDTRSKNESEEQLGTDIHTYEECVSSSDKTLDTSYKNQQ